MKKFADWANESDDPELKKVDLDSVSKNLGKLLKKNGIKFNKIRGKYQPVFGSSELQFTVSDASLQSTKFTNLVFIIQSGGNVVVNASSAKIRHLVTLNRVGKIRQLSHLNDSSGRFADIVKFTVDEIADTIKLNSK